MIRHDFACPQCGHADADRVIAASEVDNVRCPCGTRMVITFRARTRNAQWSDKDATVVYKDSTGRIRYPMRNDEPTPADCERVEIRSMAEMARFERVHGVTNEVRHFDHGEWRGLESQPGYDGRPVNAPRERGARG